MKNLRKELHKLLKTKHDRVYFTENKVPKTATFPYIVYEVEVRSDGEGTSTVAIDINGWDNAKDTTALEDMMDKVKELDRAVIRTADMSMVLALEDMKPVEEKEKSINRRLYTFIGYLH